MVKITTREHNGVIYDNLEFNGEVRTGALSFNNKKLLLKGTPTVNITKNSYKYGQEVQFGLYSPKENNNITELLRNDSNMNRVEIFFPVTAIPHIIEYLQEKQKILISQKTGGN